MPIHVRNSQTTTGHAGTCLYKWDTPRMVWACWVTLDSPGYAATRRDIPGHTGKSRNTPGHAGPRRDMQGHAYTQMDTQGHARSRPVTPADIHTRPDWPALAVQTGWFNALIVQKSR